MINGTVARTRKSFRTLPSLVVVVKFSLPVRQSGSAAQLGVSHHISNISAIVVTGSTQQYQDNSLFFRSIFQISVKSLLLRKGPTSSEVEMETRYEDIFPLKLLPDLALDIIAQFLIPSDLVSLSQSCTRFVYLRKYLPEFQDISGDNFNKRGPQDGCFCPEIYFDGPVMAQKMKSLNMEWEWRDQGFGNRKGMLWVQLVRGDEVLADSREDFPTLAPHVAGPIGMMHPEVLLIKNHSVLNLSRPGDKLRFMISVGGGGGHQLKLRNFKAKVELKKF